MKSLFTITVFIFSLYTIHGQESFSKISLSGFKVNLIPFESFSVHFTDSLKIEREVEDGILEIRVIDQTGRVPKGEITVYTNNLNYLSLHNCQLVMTTPLISDSLELVTASSFGVLKIKSDYLSVNVNAGSNLEIEGETTFYDCGVGAGSTLQSKKMLAEKAIINAMGYSRLTFNAKEIIVFNVENANVKNYYE